MNLINFAKGLARGISLATIIAGIGSIGFGAGIDYTNSRVYNSLKENKIEIFSQYQKEAIEKGAKGLMYDGLILVGAGCIGYVLLDEDKKKRR